MVNKVQRVGLATLDWHTDCAITTGPSLDAWAAAGLSSTRQSEQPNGLPTLGTSQEAGVQFALNASDDRTVIWIANRQVGTSVMGLRALNSFQILLREQHSRSSH